MSIGFLVIPASAQTIIQPCSITNFLVTLVLPTVAEPLGTFDAVVCLGSSLHHADQTGVAELFRNVRTLLNHEEIFIVEQRDYERLFFERPERIELPCGWTYSLEYPDFRTLVFHLKDEHRGLDTSTTTTITFEDELLKIAEQSGYTLCKRCLDYSKQSDRAQSWWTQYAFKML